MSAAADWIAVDWGTSNLRAWGIDSAGEVTFTASSDRGMGRLTPEDYPGVLSTLIAGHLSSTGPALDVIICGMAGARQGWLEAPYLPIPADLDDLPARAVRPLPSDSRLSPKILPGICQATPGAEDVMRGEETQLLGLAALMPGFSGVACLPGTHSKWVHLERRRIIRFTSAMTGELFEVLRLHSVLRHSVVGEADPVDRERGLADGLAEGLEAPQSLTTSLFKVRAASLLSGREAGWCAGFLSGLLIGAEIGGQRAELGNAEIPLVGNAALTRIYGQALSMIGARSRHLDATETVLAGLKAARAVEPSGGVKA